MSPQDIVVRPLRGDVRITEIVLNRPERKNAYTQRLSTSCARPWSTSRTMPRHASQS